MIYLITPTGGRPEGIALLAEYISAQTYRGKMTWIVVDDCLPRTRIPNVDSKITVESVHPHWAWRPGMNTQAACIKAGLELVPDDAVALVLEDDDIYLPGHVACMVKALKDAELVGERISRYYNVATKRYRNLPSNRHASLCSTGVRGEALKLLRTVCDGAQARIDMRLWHGFRGPKRLLETANVIGIKGLPGRPGIGVGHQRTFGTIDSGNMLQRWAGELAANYAIFGEAV